MGRCRRALEVRGAPTSASAIARRLGRDETHVRKILNAERPLRPEFLRDLGLLAGVPVAELFHAMGWLPEAEVLAPAVVGLADEVGSALQALASARPYLADLARPAPPAPLLAAEALLGDPVAAERFEVRLAQIISGARYRTATATLAEFSPRSGVQMLPEDEAMRLAAATGLSWRPGDDGCDGEFGLIRLELMARTLIALNDGQEYSWQGGIGHRTWRAAARDWPAHLLVQDAISGRQRPAAADPWTGPEPRTIVMIGGRHGTGPAAALLAEALGWQFVLVRPNLEVTHTGHVMAIPADAFRPRARSWQAIAEHVSRTFAEGRPWKAVVLVRPAAFTAADDVLPSAVGALASSPARVVYGRPPKAYLRWWGARTEGDYPPGAYDGAAQARRYRALYAEIERVLADRVAGRDLLLRIPDPREELPPHLPEVPGEVLDQTVRVAWTALRWLASRDAAPVTPGPGRLREWGRLLSADRDADLPRLTDVG